MKSKSKLILIFICVHHFMIYGQSHPINNSYDPTFTSFSGQVYSMPIIKQIKGKYTSISIQDHYGDNIYAYKKIGEVSLPKINIQETNTEQGAFPGINKKTRFAMVLNAQMKIQYEGCYEFVLNSDDGSILWLNNQLIIDNDGGHKMSIKKEQIVLDKGTYDAKLWYFQGMPDRFGFIFDSKYIGAQELCSNLILKTKPNSYKKIILDYLNFKSSKYNLNQQGIDKLSKISVLIKDHKPANITIIGHTDNQGSIKSNQLLSLRRAEFIATHLKILLDNNDIKIIAIGKGMTEPLKSNDTLIGRATNRRVEIFLKY